jgi:hypothetical protein
MFYQSVRHSFRYVEAFAMLRSLLPDASFTGFRALRVRADNRRFPPDGPSLCQPAHCSVLHGRAARSAGDGGIDPRKRAVKSPCLAISPREAPLNADFNATERS